MHRSTLQRSLLGTVLGLAIVGLALVSEPAPVWAEEGSREEQIAAIKRQLAALQQKLKDLEAAPASPAPKSVASGPTTLPAEWTKALNWRSIGPCSMGGRITALAVYENDPTTYYVGTASGGLLKTTNNGTTFTHQFDKQSTVSIGDVAVAPSNKDIVWIGTGEANPRNSVSYGDGVYKSTDGGEKWTNMGLKKSFQIGKILIHPKNPDIVYVGALGRLYGPNPERGLFKTTDGGKTWERILFVDDNTGVIDMVMHPNEPDTLVVAMWERKRDGFDSHAGAIASRGTRTGGSPGTLIEDGYDAYDPIKKWGNGGLWKTTDGGKSFRKLTQGLPSSKTGRIGLDNYRKNPNILFAVIDCEKIGMGPVSGYLGVVSETSGNAVKVTEVTADSPAAKAGVKANDLILALDTNALKSYEEFIATLGKTKPEQAVALQIQRGNEKQTLNITLSERPEIIAARRPQIGLGGEDTPGGLRVTFVSPESPAGIADLRINDLIVTVDRKKITTQEQLRDALSTLKPAAKVPVQVVRGQETKEVTLQLPPASGAVARPYSANYGGQRENIQESQGTDGHEYGGVYRSDDGGESWKRINSVNPRPMYFSVVRVDPSDDKLLYLLGVRMYRSTDGGRTFQTGGDAGVHADQHALWINPRDGRNMVIGCDGGTYVSYDRGTRWDFLNNVAIGQFYHVAVDSRRPYRVYGGLQDNGSWGGPSHTLDGRGPLTADWYTVQGGDGFVCRVDPIDPDIVYCESQEGNLMRHNIRTGQRANIKPRAGQGNAAYRFNWNTPFIISNHNPAIVYVGGNYVFRSVKRGEEPKVISPELTTNQRASATAVAESPRNGDVLWAGTDDGNLWVTKDGGKNWTNVTGKVGLPKPYWVSTIEPSRTVEGRCYVCFDAHRSDDDEPYIYVTEDHGQTWKSLRGNLPTGSTRCLREDITNPDVLYLGTEFSCYASIDRGASWTKINNNLPTVAIHELAQHPTAGEMVAATHGRSLWILDVTPLRQLKPQMVKEDATLLTPNTVTRWRRLPTRGSMYGSGHREFAGENPAAGAQIFYVLTKKPSKVELQVQDFTGKTVARWAQPSSAVGMNRVSWNLSGGTQQAVGGGFPGGGKGGGKGGKGGAKGGGKGGKGGFGGGFPGGGGGPAAVAGQYRVVLVVDGKEHIAGLKIENDPTLNSSTVIAEEVEQLTVMPKKHDD